MIFNFIKKYIYFELILTILILNKYFPISLIFNILTVTYLSTIGIVYLLLKFRYSGLNSNNGENLFTNKHVLIIGGSEGIGFSLGKRILKEKPKMLTLLGRTESKLNKAKKALLTEIWEDPENKHYRNYLKINTAQCDVSKFKDLETVIDKVSSCKNSKEKEEKYKEDKEAKEENCLGSKNVNQIVENKDRNRTKNVITEKEKDQKQKEKEQEQDELLNSTSIDVLICNCAYVCTGEMRTMKHSDLMNTVNTNICGHITSMLKVVNEMKKKKNGLIIFINTEAALYPIYGFSFYAMSKSGLWTLANIMDQELKYYNLKIVSAFLPSVNTPGFEKECLTKPLVTSQIEDMTNTLEPDYVANVIIDKMLKGKKFITVELNGFMLSALHAGYKNPESYFDLLIHISFSGVFFFISLLYKLRIENIIRKHVVKELEREKKENEEKEE